MAHESYAPSIRSSVDDSRSGKHSWTSSTQGPGVGSSTALTTAAATSTTGTSTATTTAANSSVGTHGKPEDEYEILCHDTLLPLTMTLSAVRQYVWKQSSELVMQYRRKVSVPV